MSVLSWHLFVFFGNKWISMRIRNVDHFSFKHERLNENRKKDFFNFKHPLNKILCLLFYACLFLNSCCSSSHEWMSITISNTDCFNTKSEGLNKYSLSIALYVSYRDFLLVFRQWMHINYNKKCGPFQFQALEAE